MANELDILFDKATFPDDLEIPIGDRKVKLGDLRGLTSKQQKDLAERLSAAEARERQATEMATKATEIYNNLDALQKKALESATPPAAAATEDDFETNNWWTPVRKRLTAQEKQVQDAISKITQLSTAFERAATMFATDRWNAQFDRVAPKLKKSKEYADWDVARVREYATKNQILDEFGFPSVEKAVAALTRGDDLEEARRLAREEGLKEGLQRARMASQARPTSATGKPPSKGKSAVEELGLEGLGDDVLSDDDLMQQLAEAQAAFDPTQLQ